MMAMGMMKVSRIRTLFACGYWVTTYHGRRSDGYVSQRQRWHRHSRVTE